MAEEHIKYVVARGKNQGLSKILQDAKERGGLGLPDLKLYFAACCLAWMKEWELLISRSLLE